MADDTWYAWTEIHLNEAEVDKDSKTIMSRKLVKAGDKVTADMFPEKGEFARLKRLNVIRSQPYPKVRHGESPRKAIEREYRQQIEELESGMSRDTAAISEPVPDDEDQSGQEIKPAV